MQREQLCNSDDARQAVLQQISDAQIFGLGGGRFDTASKLRAGQGSRALIINGLQSEPNNNSDAALLAEDPESVIAGAALAAFCINGSNDLSITLALPADVHSNAERKARVDTAIGSELSWLREVLGTEPTFNCRWLPASHASGEEHQLANTLGLVDDSKATPAEFGSSPLVDAGIVCINLATAYAIARAVYSAEPLTRRMVSINGATQWITLGTPLKDILSRGDSMDSVWINGRHGGSPASADAASTHVHAGIFCVDAAPTTPDAPCINCGACAPACPVGLRPDELHQKIDRGGLPAAHLRLDDCIECGACNAVCPSHLWLAQTFRSAKAEKASTAEKARLAEKAKARSEARAQRIAAQDAQRAVKVRERTQRGKRKW